MTETVEIRVPDLGTDEKVDVVEILVAAGESVAVDAGLVTLESDKASMDVPSPRAGVVKKVVVRVGDKVGEGDVIALLEVEAGAEEVPAPTEAPAREGARPGEPEGGAKLAPPEELPRRGADEWPILEENARATEAAPTPPITGEAAADLEADVLVLGAGPGGYTAAFRAADLGKKVVLVERYPSLGGVCLNVGCIPSKALLHVARVMEEAADLGEHGVSFGAPGLDLDRLRAWKEGVVTRLTKGLAAMAGQRRVRVLQGAGHFTGPRRLDVVSTEGARTVVFQSAIVAAGSRVIELPGVPHDDPRVMDSTGALELREIPERLLVIGGGIIGLEMATIYGALGAQLTIVELLDELIPGCDGDLVKPLERRLKRRYRAEIYTGTKVVGIEARKDGLEARLEGGRAPATATFDRVLVAVGRQPNADRLNLEAAGVATDERGFIPVDKQQRTNVSHIFAIGDIVPGPMLAHKASHEGKVAAEVAAGGKSAFDARVIPSVAYTDPEIAWVGLSENEATARGVPYEKGAFPWSASGRSLGMGRSDGLTKILFDPETRKVLGAGVVGPSAGDLISELALAIEMDCEAADLALTVHPHPTLSETVAFAAEAFEGTITDLYLPKKKM